MSEEENAVKLAWEGKVPVCFSVDASETNSLTSPDPFFIMISRRLYFPMVMEKVLKYFESDVNSIDQNRIWLEWNGVALKWHYPVGVLYDLCSPVTYGKTSVAVFSITIHFKNFPADELLFWPKVQDIESLFMSAIKEADAIKHRGAVMNSLQKRDHQQLWSSLLSTDLHAFWRVNSKLMEPVPGETDIFRNIPIVIHLLPVCISDSASSAINTYKISFRLSNTVEDGTSPSSVSDLLNETLPIMLKRSRIPNVSQSPDSWQFVTHGVILPNNAELLWLSQNLSYPDNFLHLILCPTITQC